MRAQYDSKLPLQKLALAAAMDYLPTLTAKPRFVVILLDGVIAPLLY